MKPEDVTRIDCIIRIGDYRFEIEMDEDRGRMGEGGSSVARTVFKGQVYRGDGIKNIDAVRALAAWMKNCLNLDEESFSVELPLNENEFRDTWLRH